MIVYELSGWGLESRCCHLTIQMLKDGDQKMHFLEAG